MRTGPGANDLATSDPAPGSNSHRHPQSTMPSVRTPRAIVPIIPIKGRGAGSNRESRFDAWNRQLDGDHVDGALAEGESASPRTEITLRDARSIISRNQSPDIPFEQSINPYQGCEHGCVYCYARPTHAYLGLSPGLDFETKIHAKTNAAELLVKELSRPGYVPKFIALGANTDPYQPTERQLEITRSVLRVLSDFNHPVGITTKSALVERDIDILGPMAARDLARVFVSVATLDHEIARRLEPRANAPARRIEAIRRLAAAGIPTGVIVGPVIPALTDKDIESVLEAASGAGACDAHYVMLRLPLEIRDLFVEWLQAHYPLRAKHVMSLVQQVRGGRDNDSAFGSRMRGTGMFAELIRQRFDVARRRHNLNARYLAPDTSSFAVPRPAGGQLSLF
jgi:DNA repair photolyase